MDLASGAFRNRLKRELPRWREEGLIDAEAEATLVERYHLGEDGISIAAATIYTLGALLIGAGIISFVAWNWDQMARPLKLLVLGGSLVTAHACGFWMWRIGHVIPRLGHALTLLGTLIFGASIGLVAQMFHIHSDQSAGWGVWAIGAATAAWALQSVPNAAVGVVVACLWGGTYMTEYEELTGLAPYLATVPFFALLFRERSAPLFVLTSFSFAILACIATVIGFDSGFGFALSMLACAAALLAFSLEPHYEHQAQALGVVALAFLAYICSFHEIAGEVFLGEDSPESFGWLAFVVPLFGGASWLMARNARKLRDRPITLSALVGVPIVLLGLAVGDGMLAAIAANVALVLLVFTSISTAASNLHRAPFWFGSLLGGLVILSRFLEFETELWLKALVFLACGVAVIVFGIGFERRLRRVG